MAAPNQQENNLEIIPKIDPPTGQCAGILEQVRTWLLQSMRFTVRWLGSVPGLSPVWTGPEEPPTSLRGVPWLRTNANGQDLGRWVYYQGQYVSDGSPQSLPQGCFLVLTKCETCFTDNECPCGDASPWEVVGKAGEMFQWKKEDGTLYTDDDGTPIGPVDSDGAPLTLCIVDDAGEDLCLMRYTGLPFPLNP